MGEKLFLLGDEKLFLLGDEKLLLLGDVNLGGELITLVGVCLELRISGRCELYVVLVCFQFQQPRQ